MDTLLIVFLTLINAVFAMSEMAVAASRRSRLVSQADEGLAGAQAAVELMDKPTEFLSTVQVGITSIGLLNGIVGEAAFSMPLTEALLEWGMPLGPASVAATALVVVGITFFTIIFGELVPKRIGQMYPETVSRWMALGGFNCGHLEIVELGFGPRPSGDARRNYGQPGRSRGRWRH